MVSERTVAAKVPICHQMVTYWKETGSPGAQPIRVQVKLSKSAARTECADSPSPALPAEGREPESFLLLKQAAPKLHSCSLPSAGAGEGGVRMGRAAGRVIKRPFPAFEPTQQRSLVALFEIAILASHSCSCSIPARRDDARARNRPRLFEYDYEHRPPRRTEHEHETERRQPQSSTPGSSMAANSSASVSAGILRTLPS
jgi:hypothetical protein